MRTSSFKWGALRVRSAAARPRGSEVRDGVERTIVERSRRHYPDAVRLTAGVLIAWFGVLKFFPRQSPVERLVERTGTTLSGGRLGRRSARWTVALLECVVGVGLVSGRYPRVVLGLLAVQLVGVLSPLVLFPRSLFRTPWAPTLEGQYVLKDLVLAAAGLSLVASLRPREDAGTETDTEARDVPHRGVRPEPIRRPTGRAALEAPEAAEAIEVERPDLGLRGSAI